MTALELHGVSKSFGDHLVLKGIDLEVSEHGVVCVIGASGSGKSTLLKCVNLLEPIDEGRMVVAGRDVSTPRVDANEVRRGIGIVFQAFNLFPHMTVLRNVTLAPREVPGLPRAETEAQAVELLGRFGLADKRNDYPDRLSGGQQQRVAIVRALAMRPQLMLLRRRLDVARGRGAAKGRRRVRRAGSLHRASRILITRCYSARTGGNPVAP